MARYIAFLKAINVGGHVVTMDRLKAVFATIGYPGVDTFIASGNVILESKARDVAAIERNVAAGLEAALGYAVPTFLRSDAELAAISVAEPFPAREMSAAVTINVGFLSQALGRAALATMRGFVTDIDRFESSGREFWWLSHTKQSESPFFKVRFEKAFGADVTFRRLTTIRKLVAKYPPSR